MKNQIRYFLLALGFFTRLPIPASPDFNEAELNHAAKYFPLVGVLIGGLTAVVFLLCNQILPTESAIILSMISSILLTGCFHEDGLADTCDGLGGGWTQEQTLSIMHDSRLGSYGATALVLALLLKYQSLSHIPLIWLPWCLIAAHSLSRFAAILIMVTQDYVRVEGKAKPMASQLTSTELLTASLFVIPVLGLNPGATLYGIIPVTLVWLYFSAKLKKRLGGYTGDCLGAMQQLTELAFYLGVTAWGQS
jgi:adenosylcobinamide-GDP ribazoletransferase